MNIKELRQEKANNYGELLNKKGISVFSGVKRVLKELRIRGYAIVLLTSSKRTEVLTILTAIAMNDYFDYVITDDDVKKSKPHIEAFRVAVDHLKIAPSKILIIDDSLENIKIAKKLGFVTIAFQQGDEDFSIADYTIKSFEELLTV